jgi:hypothetical protein
MVRGWFEEVHERGVRETAAALGLQVAPPPKRAFGPCPACRAERRSRSDPRWPAEVTSNGDGWKCYACQKTGDAVTLAALVITDQPKPRDWTEVRAACAEAGLCEPEGMASAAKLARPSRPARVPRAAPDSIRPPAAEVAELWARCRPVTGDNEVSAYLRSRCLPPSTVEDRDLARALPRDAATPSWASDGRGPWTAQSYRLIVPMFDRAGNLASLRARACNATAQRKVAVPVGFEVRGLVFADRLTQLVLSGAPLAFGEASSALMQRAGLVIA